MPSNSETKAFKKAFTRALAVVPPKEILEQSPHYSSAVGHRRRETSDHEFSAADTIREKGIGEVVDITPDVISNIESAGSALSRILDIVGSGNDVLEIVSGHAAALLKILVAAGKMKGVISKQDSNRWGKIFPEFYEQHELRIKYRERDKPFSTERDMRRIIFKAKANFLLSLSSNERKHLFHDLGSKRILEIEKTIDKIRMAKNFEEQVMNFLTAENPVSPKLPRDGYSRTSIYLAEGLLTAKFMDSRRGRKRIPSDVEKILNEVINRGFGIGFEERLKSKINSQIDQFIENANAERELRIVAYQLASKSEIIKSTFEGLLKFGIPAGLKVGKFILVLTDILPKTFLDSVDFISDSLLIYYLVSFVGKMGLGVSEKATFDQVLNYLKSDVSIDGIEAYVRRGVSLILEEGENYNESVLDDKLTA